MERVRHPNPEEFYYDFHGHIAHRMTKEMTVATYKQATATSANGALTAPFDGVHGWFFQNQSVNLSSCASRSSGFCELIPPGETGNEAGIVANVPADKAFGEKIIRLGRSELGRLPPRFGRTFWWKLSGRRRRQPLVDKLLHAVALRLAGHEIAAADRRRGCA